MSSPDNWPDLQSPNRRQHPLERMEQEAAAETTAQAETPAAAPPKSHGGVSIGMLVFAVIALIVVLGLGLMRFIPRSYSGAEVSTVLPNQWFVAAENGEQDCQQAVAPGSLCVLLLQRADMGLIPSALIGTHFPVSAGSHVIVIVSRASLPIELPVEQVYTIIDQQLENEALLDTISPNFTNVQAGERIERVVFGENGQGIQFTATLNSGELPIDIWGQFLLFPHDGQLYELDVFAEPASQWERYLDEVNTILNSMAFTT